MWRYIAFNFRAMSVVFDSDDFIMVDTLIHYVFKNSSQNP